MARRIRWSGLRERSCQAFTAMMDQVEDESSAGFYVSCRYMAAPVSDALRGRRGDGRSTGMATSAEARAEASRGNCTRKPRRRSAPPSTRWKTSRAIWSEKKDKELAGRNLAATIPAGLRRWPPAPKSAAATPCPCGGGKNTKRVPWGVAFKCRSWGTRADGVPPCGYRLAVTLPLPIRVFLA